jgi:hypothetical protein
LSGDPGGRPKKKPITEELERLLIEEAPNAKGRTWAALIAEALLRQARRGDVRAVAELANRIEGKPLQAISLGYEDSMEHMSDEELQQRIAELERQLGPTPCENKERDSIRESPSRAFTAVIESKQTLPPSQS